MANQNFIQRQTSLTGNMVAFCRYLRSKGFEIGPNETAEALLTLRLLNPFHQVEAFFNALRAILAKNQKQFLQFEELFTAYWKELDKALDAKIKEQRDRTVKSQQTKAAAFLSLKNWLYNKESALEEEGTATYSRVETFNSRSFTSFSRAELQEVEEAIRKIATRLARQLALRRKAQRKNGRLDIKKTLRLSLRRGGTILDLAFQKPKPEKWRIVILSDVSQSMELYSRFLLQFMYVFQNKYPRSIETFTFSTKLTRITHVLRHQNVNEALTAVGNEVTHWSGGTDIGRSLKSFYDRYGRRLLDPKTTVIILSDGWDVGETDILGYTMRQIQRKAQKVIWLNPLAGNPDYKPETKGMAAALPYVDVFTSGHSIESLKGLYQHLR